MSKIARWPTAGLTDGLYESFYVRAVSPDEPVSIWIRYTVQKAPGKEPKASIWFTLFGASAGESATRKLNGIPVDPGPDAPEWIGIDSSSIGPARVEGSFEDVSWSIRVEGAEPTLRHLSYGWMYRSPIPRTNPESPTPRADFTGWIECAGQRYVLDRWPGMLGHNWGVEHAWTWIWLHGTGFREAPDAWIDVVLGRVKVLGRLLPWVANGMVSFNGQRQRLGGVPRRGVKVRAEPGRATMLLPGKGGWTARVNVTAPRESTVAWTYASPNGHIHDVLNGSLSSLEIGLMGPDCDETLNTAHGGVYELGLPERQSWIELEPHGDNW